VIEFEPHAEGLILPVRASAGARRCELRGVQAGALKVAVTQAPEQGKANKAIIELLADSLGLKKSQVELLTGETSPRKRFLIRDIDRETLDGRIAARLADSN
jgi:hypothetical protein